MSGQPGFFDADERLKWLSAAGDPLERLARVIDFELFRPELNAALNRSERAKGGRPPYDAVLMLRVLVLQTLYTLSDDQTEYQLRDRLPTTDPFDQDRVADLPIQLHALHPPPSAQNAKGYLLPDFYSGATGQTGRFTEGFLLRRLHRVLGWDWPLPVHEAARAGRLSLAAEHRSGANTGADFRAALRFARGDRLVQP